MLLSGGMHDCRYTHTGTIGHNTIAITLQYEAQSVGETSLLIFTVTCTCSYLCMSPHLFLCARICILREMHARIQTVTRYPYINCLCTNKGNIVRINQPQFNMSISPFINTSTHMNYKFILVAYLLFYVEDNLHALLYL